MASVKREPQKAPILADLDTEEALLGSLWLDPGEIYRFERPLSPDDFYSAKNGQLYGLFLKHGEDAREDRVTLFSKAEPLGWKDHELTALALRCPTASHARYYAAEILRLAELRRLTQAASDMVVKAWDENAQPIDVWQAGREMLDKAVGHETERATLIHADSFGVYYDLLGKRQDAKGKPVIRLPWRSLSWFIPRLPGGTITVIGANSSVGKTAFMENCAESWAEHGFRVVFFHFELSHAIMLDRRMARQAGVSIDTLQSGELSDGDAEAIADATQRMKDWPGGVTLVHCPGWSMPRVALKIRQLAIRDRVDAVIVDYLQKSAFHAYERGLTPAQMRGQDVETLKILAEEMDIPIMLGSQLNRDAQGVSVKTRHQLRDTGEADEKGNIVLILDRMMYETDQIDMATGQKTAKAGDYTPEVKVRIDKNTLGKTGQETLILNGPRFRMLDSVKP